MLLFKKNERKKEKNKLFGYLILNVWSVVCKVALSFIIKSAHGSRKSNFNWLMLGGI